MRHAAPRRPAVQIVSLAATRVAGSHAGRRDVASPHHSKLLSRLLPLLVRAARRRGRWGV